MTSRYHLCPISDADCASVDDPIATFSSASDAKRMAGELSHRHVYGLAVKDTETGLTYWGHGFGVPVPEIEP